jgi:hypothetical protein
LIQFLRREEDTSEEDVGQFMNQAKEKVECQEEETTPAVGPLALVAYYPYPVLPVTALG